MKRPRSQIGFERLGLNLRLLLRRTRLRVWSRLLWMFLKVNVLSPSGPASIGLLYDEAVGKIMTEEQFVEAVGFSNLLPGSEALKLAMFVGYTAGGLPGVFTALLGSILPPTILMLTVAAALQNQQDEPWLQGFVSGMSPAVAGLILVVGWEISRAARSKRTGLRALLIAVVSAIALAIGLPSPIVLLGAGLLGVVLFR
jgi:chromate transporter